jgi:AcrR family transcriptional regulator
MEKRIDRRKIRTRKQLRDALLVLILEKGYDAVTIEDITERADLGRTTFYLHYKDKEHILLESIESIAVDLLQQITENFPAFSQPGLSMENRENLLYAPVLLVFHHAKENANLYRIILRGEGAYKTNIRLRQIINRITANIMTERIESLGLKSPQIPIEFMTNYFAGALLTVITWWLENDTPYSVEEMTTMFRDLIFNGFIKQFQP